MEEGKESLMVLINYNKQQQKRQLKKKNEESLSKIETEKKWYFEFKVTEVLQAFNDQLFKLN